jgi:hypothetical protein
MFSNISINGRIGDIKTLTDAIATNSVTEELTINTNTHVNTKGNIGDRKTRRHVTTTKSINIGDIKTSEETTITIIKLATIISTTNTDAQIGKNRQ